MKNLFFTLLMLSTTSAFALNCNEKFECTGGGVSKNDIKRISKQLENLTFNGNKFDLKKVKSMFKKFGNLDEETSDSRKGYDEARHKFVKTYGMSKKAELMFDLAKAEFYIDRFEDDLDHKFEDSDLVRIPYTFVGSGSPEISGIDTESNCYVKTKMGKKSTYCSYDSGSSGFGLLLLFAATNGNFGSTHGAREKSTTCEAHQTLHALVKTEIKGDVVFAPYDFVSNGQECEYGNVWIRRSLKNGARAQSDRQMIDIEDEAMRYSCEVNDPFQK